MAQRCKWGLAIFVDRGFSSNIGSLSQVKADVRIRGQWVFVELDFRGDNVFVEL